jgi:UDP-glucuronate 4-epimerase
MSRVLVTGAAGFIGYHTVARLLRDGDEVVGFDNMNPYYDVKLKEDRLSQLRQNPKFTFFQGALENRAELDEVFNAGPFDQVIHLAAQAGVRHSLTHPDAYAQSNLVGFLHILECCRHQGAGHLVYASSSSVYGMNRSMPFHVGDAVDHPVSLYAATKKSNELMAHSYSHLYSLPTTGLRFFTVYGPWGRPDMAYFSFTRKILEGSPIQLFNEGKMLRDFTYIDDIVEGVVRVARRPATPDPEWDAMHPDTASSSAPYRLYNIGNSEPVELSEFVSCLEEALGKKARIEYLPMQPGDVEATAANVDELNRDVGFRPSTPLREGMKKFAVWYRDYYRA